MTLEELLKHNAEVRAKRAKAEADKKAELNSQKKKGRKPAQRKYLIADENSEFEEEDKKDYPSVEDETI